MVNYIIFFFLNVKVNNRISRTLWRRYGHDDVHLRLLHPWGNHNFLCCAQVCFSSVSLEILQILSFIYPPTVHGYTPSAVVLSITLVILRTKVHSTYDSLSRMVYQEQGMLMGIIWHFHQSSEKYSSGRLGWIWPSSNATNFLYTFSPTSSWSIFHWAQ